MGDNPHGCSGVNVSCCSDPMPTRLMATFSSNKCGSWNGAQVPLSYNAAEDRWEGTADVPLDPTSVRFGCGSGGSDCTDMGVEFSNSCTDNIFEGANIASGCDCDDPAALNLVSDPIAMPGCCKGSWDAATITITR